MSAGSNQLLDQVRAATGDEYTIEGELGRGGMAAVFLARDIALDRRVAIKVMLPDLADVAGFQDRFVIEARTAAHLDHPGIVTVYSVKQRAGLTFIVMKYIEGRTLDHVLSTRGALEPDVVAMIGSRVAEALHFAHGAGVIHRDVKPSNIIIDSHGRPVVTDFGIAKVTTGPSITVVGSTLGTPAYMSPEQCRGLPATSASDQYSLGVMMYELLTGRAPFSGNLFELLSAHAAEAPRPIRDTKEVDPALETAVMRMLAKDPAARFPSLSEASKTLAARAPRRSQAAEMQAIIAAIAPDQAEWLNAMNATTEGIKAPASESTVEPGEFTRESGVPTHAPMPAQARAQPVPVTVPTNFVPGTVIVESPRVEAEPPAAVAIPEPVVALPPPPPSGGSRRRLLVGGVAVLLLGAIGYALATMSDRGKPALTPQPVSTASANGVPAAKQDTTPAQKPDSTPVAAVTPPPAVSPPVVAPQANTPVQKSAEKPKVEPKPETSAKARTDSIAARCSGLNLKLSIGVELAPADSVFLRRECAKKTRP